MKTEAIGDKMKVINEQEKLLDCQTEQLNSLKSTVESTVQVTIQKEIKSYSEAVANTGSGTGTVQLQDSRTKVVKNDIEEDDRSKNLIVLMKARMGGLPVKFQHWGLVRNHVFHPVEFVINSSSCNLKKLVRMQYAKLNVPYILGQTG